MTKHVQSSEQLMPDRRSYIERKYGRDFARRYSQVFRISLLVPLPLLLIGSFVLSGELGPSAAPYRWICAGLTGVGFAMLWRMRMSDIAYYGRTGPSRSA
jgi:hypothetical protein